MKPPGRIGRRNVAASRLVQCLNRITAVKVEQQHLADRLRQLHDELEQKLTAAVEALPESSE